MTSMYGTGESIPPPCRPRQRGSRRRPQSPGGLKPRREPPLLRQSRRSRPEDRCRARDSIRRACSGFVASGEGTPPGVMAVDGRGQRRIAAEHRVDGPVERGGRLWREPAAFDHVHRRTAGGEIEERQQQPRRDDEPPPPLPPPRLLGPRLGHAGDSTFPGAAAALTVCLEPGFRSAVGGNRHGSVTWRRRLRRCE